MRMLVHFPEEVVAEILLRLPVKSLIKFKSVCRSWRTLINDPSFAKRHLRFNANRVSSSAVLYLTWFRLVAADSYMFEQVHALVTLSRGGCGGNEDVDDDQLPCTTEILDLPSIPGTGKEELRSGDLCNGVLWFRGTTGAVLYNPANREFKILPRRFPDYLVSGEGFGYDSKANDYKFVRIRVSVSTKEHFAEVYTIGSDSWREIKIDPKPPLLAFLHQSKGLHYKGICYWLGTSGDRLTIVCFDMSSEEFYTIPLSDNIQKHGGYLNKLAVWNKSVVLLRKHDHFVVDMWVMDDSLGESKGPLTWTKHMTVGPLPDIGLPVAFWKSDEFLSFTYCGRLVSYNIGTKRMKYLPIDRTDGGLALADFYVESLVSLKGRN